MPLVMTNSPTRGQAWRPRGICDWCDGVAVRAGMLVLWDGSARADARALRTADVTYVCGWKCADGVRGENPGWAFRSISFREFISMLAADIVPATMPDAVAEVKLRVELVLSARPGEWVPAKRVHEKLPGQVRSGGAWTEALADLVADGRLEVRRVRSTPTASRPRTEYRYVPHAPSVN